MQTIQKGQLFRNELTYQIFFYKQPRKAYFYNTDTDTSEMDT